MELINSIQLFTLLSLTFKECKCSSAVSKRCLIKCAETWQASQLSIEGRSCILCFRRRSNGRGYQQRILSPAASTRPFCLSPFPTKAMQASVKVGLGIPLGIWPPPPWPQKCAPGHKPIYIGWFQSLTTLGLLLWWHGCLNIWEVMYKWSHAHMSFNLCIHCLVYALQVPDIQCFNSYSVRFVSLYNAI